MSLRSCYVYMNYDRDHKYYFALWVDNIRDIVPQGCDISETLSGSAHISLHKAPLLNQQVADTFKQVLEVQVKRLLTKPTGGHFDALCSLNRECSTPNYALLNIMVHCGLYRTCHTILALAVAGSRMHSTFVGTRRPTFHISLSIHSVPQPLGLRHERSQAQSSGSSAAQGDQKTTHASAPIMSMPTRPCPPCPPPPSATVQGDGGVVNAAVNGVHGWA